MHNGSRPLSFFKIVALNSAYKNLPYFHYRFIKKIFFIKLTRPNEITTGQNTEHEIITGHNNEYEITTSHNTVNVTLAYADTRQVEPLSAICRILVLFFADQFPVSKLTVK